VCSHDGNTLLHLFASDREEGAAIFLVDAGADVDQVRNILNVSFRLRRSINFNHDRLFVNDHDGSRSTITNFMLILSCDRPLGFSLKALDYRQSIKVQSK